LIEVIHLDQSKSITIDRTNALWSIWCTCLIHWSNALGSIGSSIDSIILSWSIRLVHYDRLDIQSNLHYVKFDQSNSITIDRTNALWSIWCSIHRSNTLESIGSSIDPIIISWSIDRTFTISNFDWSNSITIDRIMHYDRSDVRSIEVMI
jgi:hypothetical protein